MNSYNLFNSIQTASEAYWLGFLTADGSVYEHGRYKKESGDVSIYYCIELGLQASDVDHVQKFADFTAVPNKVGVYDVKVDGKLTGRKKARFSFGDTKTAMNLKKLECGERKSLVHKFPNEKQVPEHLLPDYIRGYLDGDGSICLKKGTFYANGKVKAKWCVSLAGSWDFIHSLADKLNVLLGSNFSYSIETRKNKGQKKAKPFSVIAIGKASAIKAFLDFVYDNPAEEICMTRKHESSKRAIKDAERTISRQNRIMIFKNPSGEVHKVKNKNAKSFAKKHNLKYSQIFSLRTGKSKKSKEGWTCLNTEDWANSNAMFYNYHG